MLWYGIVMLFVGGTIFSYAADGRTGIGSTSAQTYIQAEDWMASVHSLDGFAPVASGAGRMEMDEPGRVVIGGESAEFTAVIYTNGATADAKCRRANSYEIAAPCLILRRDKPEKHARGTPIFNENAAALDKFLRFRIADRNTALGVIAFPFAAVGAMTEFVAKFLLWDYTFFEGNALYFKWFFCWPLSAMLIIALLRIFMDIGQTIR